jgi:GTP-binding protein HflX
VIKSFENAPEPDFAVLVGVGVGENIGEESLDELCALCETCNILTAARVIQNRKDIDPTYYIGSGKVDEISILVREKNATTVVFDTELSGSKVRNLERAFGVPIIDRSKVILDIFARRARSAEGKLQVELAQLEYNLPRLIGSGGLLAKMRNSVGMRGPGEKKLELDKRVIRQEITKLKNRLAKLKENRDLNKKQSAKSGLPRVCLVGYTNSGKSTLLNTVAKTNMPAEDKLFATLDPKTVKIYLDGQAADGNTWNKSTQILLTDTVGFINKLPHEFINAFESTLDEVRYADFILHVADISNPDCQTRIQVVNEVLEKIGADKIPKITVYNKIDKLDGTPKDTAPDELYISAAKNKGIDRLKQKIKEFIRESYHFGV